MWFLQNLTAYLDIYIVTFQHAMSVMGISEDDQYNVMCIVAGILHMGNITFTEQNNYAAIANDECKF